MKDEIEKYADKFFAKIEKRIREKREEEEEDKREIKRSEQFEKDFDKLVTVILRPVMMKFLELLKKKGIFVRINKNTRKFGQESYRIKLSPDKGEDDFLSYFIERDTEMRIANFGYGYRNPSSGQYQLCASKYKLQEITKDLVEKVIVEGLKEMSK